MVQMTLFGKAAPEYDSLPQPKRRASRKSVANDSDNDEPHPPPKRRAHGKAAANDSEHDEQPPEVEAVPAAEIQAQASKEGKASPAAEIQAQSPKEGKAPPAAESQVGSQEGEVQPAGGNMSPLHNGDETDDGPTDTEGQKSDPEPQGMPAVGSDKSGMTMNTAANVFTTAGVMEPELPLGTPTCKKCNMMVDTVKSGTRLIRKTPPVWQCGSCSSKHVMLSRIFGTFPLPDFVALSDAEQTAFWKDTPGDVNGLKKAITETLTNSLVERTESVTKGKYLPLPVYAKQGFDTDLIEKDCNMKVHPVIGKTYRLDIDEVGWSKVREKCRRQVMEMMVLKSKTPLPTAPIVKAVESDHTGNTSSCSDSEQKHSKNDKKHGKKNKKGKKHKHDKHKKDDKKKKKKHGKKSKKAKKGGSGKKKKNSSSSSSSSSYSSSSSDNAKAKQAAAETEAKKLQKKVQADATKVLAKVRPLINNVAELKREAHFDDMPKTIINKLFSEHEILSSFEKEAREKIGSSATSLNFNMDDVTKASKAIGDTMNTVKAMLKQTAKLL
jgi:hypothetical protein